MHATVLRENMVLSIENGIYIPNMMGIRLEDVVVVTDGAGKVLNHAAGRSSSPRMVHEKSSFNTVPSSASLASAAAFISAMKIYALTALGFCIS